MNHAGRALIDPYKIFEKINLKPGMRAADMGCGRTGHFVFPAAKIVGSTGMVYAVDIMKEVLASLNSWVRSEGMDNVQTIWSNIEAVNKTPIPSQSLEVCFFMNVLSGIKDKSAALSEARRLIKNDGRIVVVDWFKKLGTLGPSEDAMLPNEMLEKEAQKSDLCLVENFSISDYHYCSIFKKK